MGKRRRANCALAGFMLCGLAATTAGADDSETLFFSIQRAGDSHFSPIAAARALPIASPTADNGAFLPIDRAQGHIIVAATPTGRPIFDSPLASDLNSLPRIRPLAPPRATVPSPSLMVIPGASEPDTWSGPPPTSDVVHNWPIDATAPYRISSDFGWRADPLTSSNAYHAAVDIAARAGTAVVATAPAQVYAIGEHHRLGRYVMLGFGDGSMATYGHLQEVLVAGGDRVARGDVVGLVGSTGRSTGPHLHFGIEIAGRPIDPMAYLTPPTLALGN